jgi:hypothetical protein
VWITVVSVPGSGTKKPARGPEGYENTIKPLRKSTNLQEPRGSAIETSEIETIAQKP